MSDHPPGCTPEDVARWELTFRDMDEEAQRKEQTIAKLKAKLGNRRRELRRLNRRLELIARALKVERAEAERRMRWLQWKIAATLVAWALILVSAVYGAARLIGL
jgi:predicted RNase H-like nuclease (RuvC/YqgF family)